MSRALISPELLSSHDEEKCLETLKQCMKSIVEILNALFSKMYLFMCYKLQGLVKSLTILLCRTME